MNLLKKSSMLIRSNSRFLITSAIFCLLPFAFLFSPAPREGIDQVCGVYIELNDSAGFVLNCDSSALINLAKYPKTVFDESQLLQSRPGVIPTGIVYSLPFIALSKVTGFPPAETGLFIDARFLAGFILFNFSLLFTSIFLFLKIAKKESFSLFLILTGVIALASNEVVKAFVFTPHQQIFNALIPIASVSIIYYEYKYGIKNSVKYLIAASVGLGATLYPSVVLISGALALQYLLKNINLRKLNPLKHLPLGIIITLTALPTIIWPMVVKWKTGTYFNHAAESYRQFVWVLDGFENGFGAGIQNIVNHIRSFILSQTTEM